MESAPNKSASPSTEVTPKAKRRTFSGGYTCKVMAEADAVADEPGEVAALLR